MKGKSKLFRDRKDIDGQFHRGGGGRSAEKARAHKRRIEKQLRQSSKALCRQGAGSPSLKKSEHWG